MPPQPSSSRKRHRSRFSSGQSAQPSSTDGQLQTNSHASDLSPSGEPRISPIMVSQMQRPSQSAPPGQDAFFSDGESSEDEVLPPLKRRPPSDVIMTDHHSISKPPAQDPLQDPLDEFMNNLSSAPSVSKNADATSESDNDNDKAPQTRKKVSDRPKRHVYERVDHSKIHYHRFEKELYIPVPQLERLSSEEVAMERRRHLIRARGRGCPAPISTWAQAGLSGKILAVLRKAGYTTPTPIQMQALPCIMSGRDMIGVARTGSGKTLAFMLPVLRHIAMQRRARLGDGPSALVVAPTRELAMQIYRDACKFRDAVGIRCVCAYGGSGVKEQIAELKRGADVVICTPGRMIDLLAMNSGRITNLRRVTIIVLDEADRMFDLGFEPQLTRIVENIRPDRQTVMFSATFPYQVEKLARKVLKKPVEIMVGGNSVAPSTIDQHVEVRPEDSKFFRLLELLGVWYEKGSTLVFVDRQDNADRIFRDLAKARYKCLSLHGGMDQADRDSAIVDFKNGDIKILVATSVAARGLDVKNLTLVVNYDVPSHYEDYVHRVGRTGRAGRKGTAHTFITPEQEQFAPDLVKALEMSARAAAEHELLTENRKAARVAGDEAAAAAVPDELRKMADGFDLKRKAGIVKHAPSSGYGGRGFSFENNEDYDAAKIAIRKMQAKEYGIEDELADDDVNESAANSARVTQDVKMGGKTQEEDENDGIVEISVAPKATGATTDITGAALHGSRSHSMSTKELTQQDISRMLQEAEKKAEREALRLKLDSTERRKKIALAKAQVLSIISNPKKGAKTRRLAEKPKLSLVGKRRSQPLKSHDEVSRAAEVAAAISARLTGQSALPSNSNSTARATPAEANQPESNGNRFAGELEINDYPQNARWQVTRKGALADVEEFTGCVVTTRGNFYPAGRNPPVGERKLHFLIEGPTRDAVRVARRDIRQKLDEAAAVSRPGDSQYSKYSVV